METARFMAGLYDISENMEAVKVLNPGAGSGILACAFVGYLEALNFIKNVELTCYENDSNVMLLL